MKVLFLLLFIVVVAVAIAIAVIRSNQFVVGGSRRKAMIVDVPNIYMSWYTDKYGDVPKPVSQQQLMKKYIECIGDHYSDMRDHEPSRRYKTDLFYVFKNYRFHPKADRGMVRPRISSEIWKRLKQFTRKNNVTIAVAEDYDDVPFYRWKSRGLHFLRGRDDYLSLYLAQRYKGTAEILSGDKFRDFYSFDMVPPFVANLVRKGRITRKHIDPRKHKLGRLSDYNFIRP